ncbi:c-type cytochrome [Pseudomonas schmalbachii]|uniref:C-type cytochrome n=1 Tax=Pseudomonas schmalbachii TaxID=2816993 RepID=A0ABS3TNH5_9PSED|nr:c-type cytochrome [Pseudomonas schmalbachii]MBO3274708.1 c-type cytochrome [Pseudomonas schmalbachii]
MSFHKSLKNAAGALLLALLPGLALADGCPSAEAEQGQNVFARDCAVCHSAKQNEPGMMGPNLHGVVGRMSGSLAGFSYSQALKTKGAAWSRDALDAFIAQPQAAVPGTYMPFAGLADAAERKAVTCWLSQQR